MNIRQDHRKNIEKIVKYNETDVALIKLFAMADSMQSTIKKLEKLEKFLFNYIIDEIHDDEDKLEKFNEFYKELTK